SPSHDLAADVELLGLGLAEQDAALRQQRELTLRQREQEAEAAAVDRQQQEYRRTVTDFFAACGVADEAELRRQYDLVQERAELRRKNELLRERLQQQLGVGADLEALIAELASADPVTMDEDISRQEEELKRRQEGLAQQREQIGQLKNELQNIAVQDEESRLRGDEEVLKQRIYDLAVGWAVDRTALRLVERAVARYEHDRQPGVIRAAADIFRRITAGRYETLYKPLEDNELYVRDRSGRSLRVGELSRGSREELYLAMRLGLIAEYEQRSEPMPLLLDDIMVNFDDDRAGRALAAVAEFSATRQTIILTCHRHLRDLALAAGARQVNV
ncbi:MAG: hypothetical protein PHQ27_10575, partial [Victivallales bacterium]|nr:hypothetical protein [Victivallales bacterium]